MRRVVSLMARGKNETACRALFPSIVKCVITKNPELKKLVYAYLVRFAESEPDLALLSVSSFQRSLKDPNPLIRGSALRVLASIRVPVIAPLILAAIKESSNDMSPYVRKTAALSVPKLISLEPELKDEAISLIERLLDDKTTHVLGSVVAAFTEVCPDRLDLLHAHYRKFVALLPDFDEWGQVILIQILTRYARTQFTDPLKTPKRERADSTESDRSVGDPNELEMDNDLKMLLKNTKPLLQSRNSAVVFSVLQFNLSIFFPSDCMEKNASNPIREQFASQYLGPCVKPLVRLIASSSSHKEIQQLVLSAIVSLTSRPELAKIFEPYLRSFFVKSRDSIHVKLLKLQVLTNLSTSSNIGLILREFQAYVNTYSTSSTEGTESESSLFVSNVITAIGQVATQIREVAEICLKGLIALLSNRANDAIVAQAVIVIRTQIMNRENNSSKDFMDSTESKDSNPEDTAAVTTLIIKQLVNSKLMSLDPSEEKSSNNRSVSTKSGPLAVKANVETASSKARATILWIIAEFCSRNFKAYQLAPDVLRKFSKRFSSETNLVKLQILNLAAKIHVASLDRFHLPFFQDNDEKAKVFDRNRLVLLTTYIFNLAKYDLNYDIRDRARFLRSLLAAAEGANFERVRKILFVKETPPVSSISSPSKTSDQVLLPTENNHDDNTNGAEFQIPTEADKPRINLRKRTKDATSDYRIGTLAHFLNQKTPGYEELPGFPEVAPDPAVRNIFREKLLEKKKQEERERSAMRKWIPGH